MKIYNQNKMNKLYCSERTDAAEILLDKGANKAITDNDGKIARQLGPYSYHIPVRA